MKKGYINGSDILFKVDGANAGSCTSHTTDFNSETKDRAVKPVASVITIGTGMWKETTVTGQSIEINFDGLRKWDETEHGFKTLLAKWKAGQPIEVECYERGGDPDSVYLKGEFIITSLKETAPAGDDATYSGTLRNSGEPTLFDASKLTGETLTEPANE